MNRIVVCVLIYVCLSTYYSNAKKIIKREVEDYNENDEDYIDVSLLSPETTKCRLSTSEASTVICSKIPSYCPSESCGVIKKIVFDSNVQKLESSAFHNYLVENELDLVFTEVSVIETDAFNGLTVLSNGSLNIKFTGKNSTVELDRQYDGLDDEYYDEKSKLLTMDNGKFWSTKTQKLTINSNAFRELFLFNDAKLNVSISDYKTVDFAEYSLNSIKQMDHSHVGFYIKDTINLKFSQNCAKDWDVSMGDSILIDSDGAKWAETKITLFKINATNVLNVIFEKNSFSDIKQGEESVFQIIIDGFNKAQLKDSSFKNIVQNKLSVFEVNLIGKTFALSGPIFENIIQAMKSQFIALFDASATNICVPRNSFYNIEQDDNSTLRVNFVGNKKNLNIQTSAFNLIKQRYNSFVELYGLNHDHVLMSEGAISNLKQSNFSFFEVRMSHANKFLIDAKAFKHINQSESSSLRIGFTSPTGRYQQHSRLFDDLHQDSTSEIIYDFTQAVNFRLNFAPRAVPRMIGGNSNIDLAKTYRPRKISLQEYLLKDTDFCKIKDIPADLLVRLAPKTRCSCAVFYLYRQIKNYIKDNSWLSHTPQCFQETYQINNDETMNNVYKNCEFENKINSCEKNTVFLPYTIDRTLFRCGTNDGKEPPITDINESTESWVYETGGDNVIKDEQLNSSRFLEIIQKSTLITILIIVGTGTLLVSAVIALIIVLIRVRNRNDESDCEQCSDVESDERRGRIYLPCGSSKSKKGKIRNGFDSNESETQLLDSIKSTTQQINNNSNNLNIQTNPLNDIKPSNQTKN